MAFSQSGTYILGGVPREAVTINSDGAFEFPIYLFTGIIKLKWTKRIVVIYDKGEEYERKLRGVWSREGDQIKISLESKTVIKDFIVVDYESGTYLKTVGGNQHYKKQ